MPIPSYTFYFRSINALAFIVLAICCSQIGFAQGELPPISTYSYTEHGGGIQNWMIDQSDNRNIYVANNEGLLEYDGERWKLYPTDNQTLMRSVKVHRDKIYSGCYMDFGYWKADPTGFLEYKSLVNLLPEPMFEDEQVWNIHHSDDWIIFQSLNRIFLYEPELDQIKILDFEYDIVRSFQVEEVIYFQSIEHGLYEIKNGEAQRISDAAIFKEQIIIGLFSIEDQMIAISDDAQWININVNDQSTDVRDIQPNEKGVTIYSATKLNNREIALGTISQGVLITDSNGTIISKYDQVDGLTNNTALSLYCDLENSLWIGLDDGVNVIHRESMLKIARFEENIGAVYASITYDGLLFLGTNQGLYVKDADSQDTKFTLCAGTQGQVWGLEIIDNQLFCGHNNGVFILNGRKVINHISDFKGVWGFRKVPKSENLIMLGSYSNTGLHIITKVNESYTFRNHIENYRMSSRFFEWIDDHSLIVNHEYKGLYRVDLDKNFTRATTVIRDLSIEKGRHSGLVKHDGKILYSKSDGLWVYDDDQMKFVKDQELSFLQAQEDYISGKMISLDDKLWLFGKDFIHSIAKNRFSGKNQITSIPLLQKYREGNYGYETISHIGDEKFLVGSTVGYTIIDLSVLPTLNNQVFKFTDILVSNNQDDTTRRISLSGDVQLNHYDNNLSFAISSNRFGSEATWFEYKLNDGQWHSLNSRSTIELSQLNPADYSLQIKKLGADEIDVIYNFKIIKPWYQSSMAIFAYLLAAVILFFVINRAYARYYQAEQNKLIEENRTVLELKELETRERITKMENEKLQLDIENKNRELGISTMHMTKQNEILGAIRTELSGLKGDNEIEAIIKLVDQNINLEEDWNMFEKAFNEADKGFFKNVKITHPGLTPSDLKLCAYLRLNLTSKEIAPLLNISIRSVEIKRYRLRKKLDLNHEEGLVNYLLNL